MLCTVQYCFTEIRGTYLRFDMSNYMYLDRNIVTSSRDSNKGLIYSRFDILMYIKKFQATQISRNAPAMP